MVAFLDLAQWHARLANHFGNISRARSTRALARSVFALEHGLSDHERDALSDAIRLHIRTSAPRAHSLPWIVYAAELGYRYSGDEYWQTFEAETPGWSLNGDRCWLRKSYQAFQKQYNGAEPKGAWADQFSIICWPITHALLPKDLQQQLARVLYESRHLFSAEIFESPSRLGEIVADRSWNAGARFRNFVQETDLVGQIAKALLLQENVGSDSLIFPATLERVRTDLEKERSAREWLRGARQSARDRTHVRGLDYRRSTAAPACHTPVEARRDAASLGIEPRLVLRWAAREKNAWMVFLETPDLSALLHKFPQLRTTIAETRCEVAGAAGPPLARGRCLHGPQLVELARWPRSDEVLLKFERSDSQLDFLLRTECLLRPGSRRLFRIASDGLAYESRGLSVRPGQRYVILSTSRPFASDAHLRQIEVACNGVFGALLELPAAIDRNWEESIKAAGLGGVRTVEVWPSGLAAAHWDGEGHGEWLASERPCLAIRTDHPVAALTVSMASFSPESTLEIAPVRPGVPVFVELPQLPVGLHSVRIGARGMAATEDGPLGTLDVVMRIREAKSWSPAIDPTGPLLVLTVPLAPTMEQLWEGQCDLSLRGPQDRKIRGKAVFYCRTSNQADHKFPLPELRLPVSPDVWRSHFERHICRNRAAQAAYDAARECRLEFTADELGAFTLPFERSFTPLRWVLGRDAKSLILIDDSGATTAPDIIRMAFEAPLSQDVLPSTNCIPVSPFGGLYLAKQGAVEVGIIVPPTTITGFDDLGCSPSITGVDGSLDSIARVLTIAALWGRANSSGNLLAASRRRDVLRALTQHVFHLIGGTNWAASELTFDRNHDAPQLARSIARGTEGEDMSNELTGHLVNLMAATCQVRASRLAALGRRTRLFPKGCDADWIAEYFLRAASDASQIEAWAGERLREGLQVLLNARSLARAARFLVLATADRLDSQVVSREVYPSWDWK